MMRCGHLCCCPGCRAAKNCSLQDEGTAAKLGPQARKHVVRSFSRTAFGDNLEGIVRALAGSGPR